MGLQVGLIMVIKTAPINQSTYGRHRFENVDSMIEKINPRKFDLSNYNGSFSSFWDAVDNYALPVIIIDFQNLVYDWREELTTSEKRPTIQEGLQYVLDRANEDYPDNSKIIIAKDIWPNKAKAFQKDNGVPVLMADIPRYVTDRDNKTQDENYISRDDHLILFLAQEIPNSIVFSEDRFRDFEDHETNLRKYRANFIDPHMGTERYANINPANGAKLNQNSLEYIIVTLLRRLIK